MGRFQVDTWPQRVAGWLIPPQCLLCPGRGQPPGFDLCSACEGELPALVAPCGRCGLPRVPHAAASRDAGCGHCSGLARPFVRCFAPYLYGAHVDGVIHALKYDGALANARVLGILLGRAVAARGLQGDVDLLVPMPLHPDRLVERGFNQSFEIARFTGRVVGRPCEPLGLSRTRATAPQVALSRPDRARNVTGAFGPAAHSARVAGRRIALVDDVVTTGSTASEASRALLAIGAVSVEVWSVARALAA
jgi:ComF family protein